MGHFWSAELVQNWWDEPNFRLKHIRFVDIDSRTVGMKVGTRLGVCNNTPAESTEISREPSADE